MYQSIRNILQLGFKELWGLLRDPLLIILILYNFSLGVYLGSMAQTDSVQDASIAIVDEDNSSLSLQISDAFLPPMFLKPKLVKMEEVDEMMDNGEVTFVLVIPQNFERDVLSDRCPEIQLNVDATRMSQAFTGTSYIQQITMEEISEYVDREKAKASFQPAKLVIRNRYNPNLISVWDGAVNTLVNNVSMLALILTGAALLRERESGTLEHLLVMPVTSFEIMVSKVWSMGAVVLGASAVCTLLVVKELLGVPIAGSFWLFIAGVALLLFAMNSFGIFLACVSSNMPQLGLLMILILLPLQMLSGGSTPQDSMPPIIQFIMQFAPTTHFVTFSNAILMRGAGFDVVWVPFAKLFAIGIALFLISLQRFRKTIAS